MATTLDLHLLTIARFAGQDQPELPGLHLAEPPRRPARSRAGDHLLLYLTLLGNSPLTPGKLDEILGSLAKQFYGTAGSVTAALRASAEALNASLLERNVRGASTGRQSIGLLTQAVLRGDQLYLAQSGPVHAFLITAGQVQHLHDEGAEYGAAEDGGLGLGRATPIRYSQTALQPGDALVLSAQPSPTWTPGSLSGVHGQGLESLRRRLLDRAALELDAVVLQARPGAGKILRVRPSEPPTPERAEAPRQEIPVGETAAVPAAPQREERQPTSPDARAAAPRIDSPKPIQAQPEQPAPAVAQAAQVFQPPAPAPVEAPPAIAGPTAPPPAAPLPGIQVPAQPAAEPPGAAPTLSPVERDPAAPPGVDPAAEAPPAFPRPAQPAGSLLNSLTGAAGTAGRPLARAGGRLLQSLRLLLVRMLPGESFFTIPGSTMAFIAFAVPVFIVAMASYVYLERGREAQYGIYYSQAQEIATQVGEETDPAVRRLAWETALKYVRQAHVFRRTPESQALFTQAQQELDALDLIKRPDFRPAIIGGLPENVRVTSLVISENDLYLLDGNSGNVLRALATTRGYEIDRTFQCGSRIEGVGAAGALIDIAPWVAGGEPDAAVVGLDAQGNALFCSPGAAPQAVTLTAPPNMALGALRGFTADRTDLYVLDPASNAVWVYWNGDLSAEPQFFFGEEIPPLEDVIDLAVHNGELYLLHETGGMTLCIYSGLGVSPTRCSESVPYTDLRAGRENQPLEPINPFRQVLFSPPPDPSLYVLEPRGRGIYHFSLRNLAFQRQFVPTEDLPAGQATAFFVNQLDRTLYLAIGHQVFYAVMP